MYYYSLLGKAALLCEVEVVDDDEEDDETIPILPPFTFADDDESDELIKLTTCPKLV